jgi:glycosyltransferase involved in cell wall biosynthesis
MARIVHILRRLVPNEWGGTETVVTNLCRQQQARGHSVEIVCTSALSVPGRDWVEGISVRRFPYSYAHWPLTSYEESQLDGKGGNPLSFSLMRYLMRKPAPDMFHVHADGRLGAIVRFAARHQNTPYVFSVHGGYYDIPEAEQNHIQSVVRHRLDWGKPASWLLGTRRLLDDAAALLFVNPADAERAAQVYPGKHVVHLPNGVDSARWSSGDAESFRRRFSLAGRRIVLCVARLDPQKDQVCLVRAFGLVAQTQPTAHLVLVGPVSVPGYDREVQAEANRCGVASRVTIVPGLEADSPLLPAAYRAAEVCVLPSRHEPFGIAVLEGWAARRPVVASDVGGLARLVRAHGGGLLFPPGDHQALARQLLVLLNCPSRRRTLAQVGFHVAAREYSWTAIADRLEAIYEMIGRERSKPWHSQPKASWQSAAVIRSDSGRGLRGPYTASANKS